MMDHVGIQVDDLAAARRFYDSRARDRWATGC